MRNFDPIEPIDYLVIGHVTQDIIPGGFKLGGTAAYAAKTAQAFGLRVGMVTSCSPTLELPELEGISVFSYPSEYSSTFENVQTPTGRIQHIHHKAENLNISMVPETWKKTPIVHLGPVCEEIDPNLARSFPESMVGVTPQGWLRTWDANGLIRPGEWLESDYVLSQASAAVISIEDVQGDEQRIEEMLTAIRILVVTEGFNGARLYWNGDLKYFKAPKAEEVDPTGAGDIFATAFFCRYKATRDPWEAARLAIRVASHSVTRPGLLGVPTQSEVQSFMYEILPGY